MKALILGGSGMLGHKLWQRLAARCEADGTLRRAEDLQRFGIFEESRAVTGVRAEDFESVKGAFASVQPDVAINCIGIVKQDAAAKDSIASINVNSLFPNRLAQLCRAMNTRLIHISTDCVFSGRKG